MYHYNYTRSLISRLINVVDAPLQIEFQPGIHCGTFRCPYCYGEGEQPFRGIMKIDAVERLLVDLKGKVQFIAISGITTDPQTYPYFDEMIGLISKMDFKFGISTKGHLLSDECIDILSTGLHNDCFIAFSVDAFDDNSYCELRGLKKEKSHYTNVRKIVADLKKACDLRDSKLNIKITYLLFKSNSKKEHIEKFIGDFKNISTELRFSIPQVPNSAAPFGNYLEDNEIKSVLKELKVYKDESFITVLDFDKSSHDIPFDKCWAQRFNMVIDKAGNVFPCPQVTTKPYGHLSYGNIVKQRFEDIWNSEERRKLFDASIAKGMKCGICDRKDEQINIDLNEILG